MFLIIHLTQFLLMVISVLKYYFVKTPETEINLRLTTNQADDYLTDLRVYTMHTFKHKLKSSLSKTTSYISLFPGAFKTQI